MREFLLIPAAEASSEQGLVTALESVTVGQILALVAFIAGVVILVRKVHPFFKGIENFLQDWNGIGERPGVRRKPGVMERISTLDTSFRDLDSRVQRVEGLATDIRHEVKPNSGSSLADKVNSVVLAVGAEPIKKQHEREENEEHCP